MAYGIDPNEEFEYVLGSDRELPAGEQTVFLLRRLGHSQRVLLENMTASVDRKRDHIVSPTGTLKELILRAGLKGWRNYKRRGKNGEPDTDIPFETETGRDGKPAQINVLGEQCTPPTMATLGVLNPAHVIELCNAITEGLDDDDRKN